MAKKSRRSETRRPGRRREGSSVGSLLALRPLLEGLESRRLLSGIHADSTAALASVSISVRGINVSSPADRTFTEPVASFTDTAGLGPSGSYLATIHWGDNTSSTGTIGTAANRRVPVSGTHSYASAGIYQITTTVQVIATPTDRGSATSQASVSSPVLAASGVEINATRGNTYNGAVATFTDSSLFPGVTGNINLPYQATIRWGDGSPATQGTITQQSSSQFQVNGSHAYSMLGQYQVSVSIGNPTTGDAAVAVSPAIVEVAGPIDDVKLASGSMPESITSGPDGNLWFTDPGTGAIGQVTTGGVVTDFNVGLATQSSPYVITSGPDGNLWFTQDGTSAIGRITPQGAVTQFTQGFNRGAQPEGITSGPDGNLWFADNSGAIGRITPQGVVTEFSLGLAPGSSPGSIAPGPDGNLWFTDNLSSMGGGGAIGRITPRGVITEFPLATPGPGLFSIAAGPDGALWFTEAMAGKIGRITTSGVVTEFSNGLSSGGQPYGITSGPDGNFWFVDHATNHVDRITTSGVITPFAIPTSSSSPYSIVTGPDRNLWFSRPATGQIGQVVMPQGVVSTGEVVSGQVDQPLTNTPFATFTDRSSLVDLARSFSPIIAFGDGTSGTGLLSPNGQGSFSLVASHTYATAGTFHGSASLTNAIGTAAPANVTANINGGLSFVVTNTNDSGRGSLRQAILAADQVGGHAITFAIPASGVATISLASPLPAINGPTIIDGASQASFEGVAALKPLVEVDGRATNSGVVDGLVFDGNSGGSLLQGLSIFGFDEAQVLVETPNVGLRGNYLGLRADGTIPVPISGGPFLSAAPGLTSIGVGVIAPGAVIGGPNLGDGNVISGNAGQGIQVAGPSATSVSILGNVIGLDPTGSLARANAANGIAVVQGANHVSIGPGNTISGNGVDGIAILGSSADLIAGNSVGTDASGTRAVGNGNAGILVDQGSGAIVIGGTNFGSDNTVSGNGSVGIALQGGSSGITIDDNRVGTDRSGQVAVGNGIAGILISDSPGNVVGPENLVSGNGTTSEGAGIWIDGPGSTGNRVFGNRVGTDLAGEAALPNSIIGLLINEASGNTIGGSTPAGPANLVSGNTEIGVMLAGLGATANTVDGNLIGTDATGTRAIGNGSRAAGAGVYIENAPGNLIGGSTPGTGNLISGNGFDGVQVFGPGSIGNVLQGNKVGTDLAGTARLGNGDFGLLINGSPGTRIVANVVAANAMSGIVVSGPGTPNTLIQANTIGQGVGGRAMGNGAFGILIINDAPPPTLVNNVDLHNTLGPIRDTTLAPTSAPTAGTKAHVVKVKAKPKGHLKLQPKATSFGTRPMTKHPSARWKD